MMKIWLKLFLLLSSFMGCLEARTLVFTYKSPDEGSFFPSTYHNTQIEFKVSRRSGEFKQAFATQEDQLLTLTITDEGPDLLNPYAVMVYIQTIKPRSPPLPSFFNLSTVGPVYVQEDGGGKERVHMVIDPFNLESPGPMAIALFIF